jgi:predicted ATPase
MPSSRRVPGVTIRLLGGFAASSDTDPVPESAWRLKKGRELVKLLALAPGHRLHREQLMEALWADLAPAAAANNLNQAVHAARRALGPEAIEAKDGLLELHASVDVELFEQSAVSARASPKAAAYRAALTLYTGELLPENRYDDFAAVRRDELAMLNDDLERELGALGSSPGPRSLPADTSSFVGRSRELEELRSLLTRTRLLTLSGTGGAGKTRLALELTRRVEDGYADGAAFVELAAVARHEHVEDAVAAALDVRSLPGQPTLQALTDFAAERRLLLVLDNCEHVVASCTGVVDALLRSAQHLAVITTTREPLRLPGELVFRVPSLGIPDPEQISPLDELLRAEAVSLFVERAAAVTPGFTLTSDNATAVARICFRLDGLPLALELAAGRVGALGPEAIAARLDDRFRLLRAGSRAAPTRQQTLSATLRWSHDLLERDERVLFRRLAVFSGFELGAAEAVCADSPLLEVEIADVLGRLVEKSLVGVEERAGEQRYRLLETVRLYAQEQLEASGESAALADRHAHWALALFERDPGAAELDREAANLRAALDTLSASDAAGALRLCVALMPFWLRRIDLAEAHRRFADALAAAPEPTALRAQALLAAAAIHYRSGTLDTGFEQAEEAFDVAVAIADPRAEWHALHRLSEFAVAWDDGDSARRRLEQGLVIARREGLLGGEAIGVYSLGVAHCVLGDPAQAEELLGESIELLRGVTGSAERIPSLLNISELLWGDLPGFRGPRLVFEETLQPFADVPAAAAIGYVLANRAAIARMRGELTRARELIDESNRHFVQLGDERGTSDVSVRRAYLELAEGFPALARRALEQPLEFRRAANDRRGIGIVLAGLGLVDTILGDFDGAARELSDARALFRRAGDRWGLASALWRTADLELARGRPDDAEAALAEAVTVLGETRRIRWLAHGAFRRGELALELGGEDRAEELFDESRRLYAASGYVPDHAVIEATLGPAQR